MGRHRESSEAKIEGCVFMAPGYRGDNQYCAQDQSAILVTRLLERLGALAPGRMRQTDHALALVLGISEAG